MVRPGTHLVKNHASQSKTNESQSTKKSLELKMLQPLCNQTVNLKTYSKTLYYSMLKLKYIPSILKHIKGQKKYVSFNKSHNNFHRNYANGIFLQVHMFRSIDQSLGNLCVLWDTCYELFQASLGIFMHQERRRKRYQIHWLRFLKLSWGRICSGKVCLEQRRSCE